jgi:lipoate-protein ligase A
MTWRLLGYDKNSAFENMAIDEAIFRETIKNQKQPTLRFYGWQPAAISLGYFQEFQNEVHFTQCQRSGVDIVRRLTGGKAVFHSDEITYSLVAGTSEDIFPGNIVGTYEKISLCLARGLSLLGINAHLAEAEKIVENQAPDLMSCCFSAPAGNELLVAGRKICGSAQTRTRGGFLQHGSLLMTFDPIKTASLILGSHSPAHTGKLKSSVTAVNELIPTPVSAETLCDVLKKGFAEELGIDLVSGSLTGAEKEMSVHLIQKYKSDAWTRERKKDAFKMD